MSAPKSERTKTKDFIKAFEMLLATKETELRKMTADAAKAKKAELLKCSKSKQELDSLWQRLAAAERRSAECGVEHKRVLDRNRVLEADLVIHSQRLSMRMETSNSVIRSMHVSHGRTGPHLLVTLLRHAFAS